MANIKLSFDDLVEIIRLKEVEKLSSRKIAGRFGISKSTVNYFMARKTFPEFWEEYDKKPVAGGTLVQPEQEQGEFKGKRFLFTSAQNNTYHHEKFIDSLEHYSKHLGAQIVVGTFSYNKNGFQNGTKQDEWIDPRLEQYVVNEQMVITEGLVWCGELNILPTAVNPLSGFKNYCGADSIIVPHTQIAHESVATPRSHSPKMMYTTGSGTLSNYIEKKAGQKAKWHHTYGACLVEVDEEGLWFVRQINCKSQTGEFQDLGTLVRPEGVEENLYSVEGIQWGDIHADKLRKDVAAACWGFEGKHESMAEDLMPRYQFAHDTLDVARRNHHNMQDPYFLFKQFTDGKECIAEEVEESYNVLEAMSQTCDQVIVVESNHDLALERWLKEQDYKKDPVNAVFFLELQLENFRALERGEALQTFKTACEIQCGHLDSCNNIRFLKTDESFIMEGIECGSHGHNGASGARGSITNFANQGVRHNLGHSHASGIRQGVYQSGACMLVEDSGYAKGGSGWSITHIVTYSGGKRTLVTMKWSEKEQRWKWRA